MIKKVFLEIVAEWSKREVLYALCFLVLWTCIAGSLNGDGYIDWFQPILVSLVYAVQTKKAAKRPPNVYFYTPSKYNLRSYLWCRFWMECGMVFGYLILYQIADYIINGMIRKQNMITFVGVNPPLEVMCIIIVLGYCMVVACYFYRQKMLGEKVWESKRLMGVFAANFIMIIVLEMVITISSEEVDLANYMPYQVSYCIVLGVITAVILKATISYVRDTMKAIYEIQAQ